MPPIHKDFEKILEKSLERVFIQERCVEGLTYIEVQMKYLIIIRTPRMPSIHNDFEKNSNH